MTDSASGSDVSTFIHPEVPPSGAGCVDCDAIGSWWLHLRRCAACGHVGCCDDSLHKHGTKHAHETGHRVMQSYEPGEDWFWDFETESIIDGPALALPTSHPLSQPTPGPADRVPADWEERLGAGS